MHVTPAVDELFKNVPVAEIERFLSQKRLEVQQRKRELKDTIASKYKQVLECADLLSSLHSLASSTSAAIHVLLEAQQALLIPQAAPPMVTDFRFTSFLSPDEEARLLALEGKFVVAASLAPKMHAEILSLAKAAMAQVDAGPGLLTEACLVVQKIGNFSISDFQTALVSPRLQTLQAEEFDCFKCVRVLESLAQVCPLVGIPADSLAEHFAKLGERFAQSLQGPETAWGQRVSREISDHQNWRKENGVTSRQVPIETLVQKRRLILATDIFENALGQISTRFFAAISERVVDDLVTAVAAADGTVPTERVNALLAQFIDTVCSTSGSVNTHTVVACQLTSLGNKFPDFKDSLASTTRVAFQKATAEYLTSHQSAAPTLGDLLVLGSKFFSSMDATLQTTEALAGVRTALKEASTKLDLSATEQEVLDFVSDGKKVESTTKSEVKSFIAAKFFYVLPVLDRSVTLKVLGPVADTSATVKMTARGAGIEKSVLATVPLLQGLVNSLGK